MEYMQYTFNHSYLNTFRKLIPLNPICFAQKHTMYLCMHFFLEQLVNIHFLVILINQLIKDAKMQKHFGWLAW